MLKPKPTAGDTSWFVRDRFGMFIHWGLYALPSRHEWVQSREQITPQDYYEHYFTRFDPYQYDPRKWAVAAREAGMKYVVITSKHHEGFCLWDSDFTDYKVTNTPYGKDLLVPFVEAFRAEGLRVGFYYSLIDWHHPEFPIDIIHPLRDHPDAEKNSPYECGFEAFEDSRMRFDVRYYLVAILFIIFDLEIAFLFPWAVALRDIGIPGLLAMAFFLTILVIGFIYEWKKAR